MSADVIEFAVEGPPPAYDPGYSIENPKHPRYRLTQKLREVAKKAMKGRGLFKEDISLEIEHQTSKKEQEADSANIIAGIANALQGIIYENDCQIKEIHYRQRVSERDMYRIRIKKI